MNDALDDILLESIDGEDIADAERLLAKRLGVHVQDLDDLSSETVDDLDTAHFGIGWWKHHLGDRRRIFISDYLFSVWAACPRI